MADTTRRRVLTLTGADRHTDLHALGALAREHPWVEIALLVSEDNHSTRYWTFDAVVDAVDTLARFITPLDQLAIHTCGSAARQRLYGDVNVRGLCSRVGRLQLNGKARDSDIEQCLIPRLLGTTFITQVKIPDDAVELPVVESLYRRAYLVDASGGRGILPREWRRPLYANRPVIHPSAVGFAGGLSPENIARELPRILDVTYHGWWIDLETALRTDPTPDGRFDLDRAWLTVHEVERVLDRAFDWRRVLP